PGSHPGEGSPYGWSAVINSVLQPTLGLRWLLCYEESDRDVCHLQKAAPKHWFAQGQRIKVESCPTRFGEITWSTEAAAGGSWSVVIETPQNFAGDLMIHIHPPNGRKLSSTSVGRLQGNAVLIERGQLQGKQRLELRVQ
ncbi:MAG TPA: hypothetical protein VGE93_07420, partial [Bryobacteraceae bacterium]